MGELFSSSLMESFGPSLEVVEPTPQAAAEAASPEFGVSMVNADRGRICPR
jgi:hypothetical protein